VVSHRFDSIIFHSVPSHCDPDVGLKAEGILQTDAPPYQQAAPPTII
jgi:hypothetical protein